MADGMERGAQYNAEYRKNPVLASISGEDARFIDRYFDVRPQLKRPKKGMLGYEIDSLWRPFVESLLLLAHSFFYGDKNNGVFNVCGHCGKDQAVCDLSESSARVGGRNFEGSIEGLERRLLAQITEEQDKPQPNNALIAVLCDAVRFTRYHVDYVRA